MSSSWDDPINTSHVRLVRLAQAGNNEAFASLVQIYEREIYGYLLSQVGNSEDAYDYAQQTFFKAWRKLSTLDNPFCFKPWLYTIARNLAYDHWRSRRTCLQSWENLEVDDAIESLPGPEEHAEKAELIKMALTELPPKLRDCLLLQVVGGFSRHEVAKLVGISEASVGTYVSSARKQLRTAYQHLENERGGQADESSKAHTLC